MAVCGGYRFLSVSSAILKQGAPNYWKVNRTVVRHLSVTQSLRDSSRRYAKSHEWASLSGNTAKVGITHYAQDKLGEVVYVDLPEIGDLFGREETFGAVESVKAASDLYSPLSGTVKSVNEQLQDSPEIINESPIDKGWIMELEISDSKEYDDLLSEKEYKQFIEDSN